MNTGEKWNNYFVKIINKYNLKVSEANPLIIFLDGKNITGNKNYNLVNENKNSFNDVLEQTVKHCTKKFNCIAISGVDEVSFIFEEHNELKNFITKRKYKTHEIISIFSQYFYNYFNNIYKQNSVYFHCKCSNIPKGKINSYIKHRSSQIYELQLTYFLKRKSIKDAGKIKLKEKIEMCKKDKSFSEVENFAKGRLYKKGEQIDLDDFLLGKITIIPEKNRKEVLEFLDLNDFFS